MIKNNEEKQEVKINHDFPCLINLNMNKINCYNKNIKKIELFKEGIERTNLLCLDLTKVFVEFKSARNKNYYDKINEIKEVLEIKQTEYNKTLCETFVNENEIKILSAKLEKKCLENFQNLEEEIKIILNY